MLLFACHLSSVMSFGMMPDDTHETSYPTDGFTPKMKALPLWSVVTFWSQFMWSR